MPNEMLISLGERSVNAAQSRQRENFKYLKTIFFSIRKLEVIEWSESINILRDADSCIVVHYFQELAIKNWYNKYGVEYLDSNGIIRQGCFDEEYTFCIDNFCKPLTCADLQFRNSKSTLFVLPWNKPSDMVFIWKLYLRCKECKTSEEVSLLCKLAYSDRKVVELNQEIEENKYANVLLKKERDLYKGILDDIKQLIKQSSCNN